VHLKKDAPADVIATLDSIEATANDCFRSLKILKYPSNLALWAILVGSIRVVEGAQKGPGGSNTATFAAALINTGRLLPVALKWVNDHGWEGVEPLSTTLSPSERRIPAEAVEHREEPPAVDDVEQAHDLAHPPADDRQRGFGLDAGPATLDL